MKLKLILLNVLMIVTVLSCNTESVDLPEQKETADNTLVKRIVYNIGTDDEYTETFNYDGNKLTSVHYSYGAKNVYTYDDNDNLVKDEYFEGDGLVASVSLEYNLDNKIASYIETFFEFPGFSLGGRRYKHIFTYNNDGTIADTLYVSDHNAEYELSGIKTFTLNGSSITEILYDWGYNISYRYDNKNGAFKNIHAIEALHILSQNEFGAAIYGNTNNIVSHREKYTNSVGDNYNDSYEYTYNEKNYPKTCVYNSKEEGIEDTETIEYFYQ
ncbi:hypothetical protein VOI54_16800 [Tamlana sp. 2201CG12-4]|uniref:hypothetical protein n=1 Tax=Tamlana sp. 2201CG12-4 TaxID=3112582 RepID=UPI002DC0132D|nr:hypothetical protein [Tamlana sp. 2201CG12-4]MEC3908689.1 hypothetical protein [Tamlana sp. 2201CG12-4]